MIAGLRAWKELSHRIAEQGSGECGVRGLGVYKTITMPGLLLLPAPSMAPICRRYPGLLGPAVGGCAEGKLPGSLICGRGDPIRRRGAACRPVPRVLTGAWS